MKKIGCFICLFMGCVNVLFAQTQKGLNIVGETPGDNSGSSVSMPDAHTVAIGSWSSSAGAYYGGQTRVFSWGGSDWQQKGSEINGDIEGDWSGHSVSMPDANTLAIGIPRHDDNGNDAGKTKVYVWNGVDWEQKGTDIDGEAQEDRSGYCVMMPDANTIAIGAPRNDNSVPQSGHVRIYSWNGIDDWVQKGMDIDGEAMWDRSGKSISMPDANTVAIGAFENSEVGQLSGHVRVFEWSGSSWVQKGVDIDGDAEKTWLGYSVSMPDANTLAIGSPAYDDVELDRGNVRIYKWNGTWQQIGSDIIGEAFADNMGFSVSMPDEFTLAVGVVAKDVTAFEAGQVRIYSWDPASSDWVQRGIDINGTITYDYLGWSVSMPDPGTVAIGAREGGSGPGYVQVYNVCSVNNTITTSQGTISTTASSATYQWLDCDNGYATISGETGQDFTPNANGSYAVEVSYGGCIDTSECAVINWVGLTEVTFKSTVTIYPNPVKDNLHFDFEHEGSVTIEITDVSGKSLQTKSLDTNVIDVKMLPQGLYLLKVFYDNKVVTGRFTKQ
ncbi:MAG: T9SS type A sorting domain-containing protein [Crocinitomicaceae bacterium]|nr:T9SS type A sorting domain-containing protein [Flavobacteriales bacterium]NQZ37824.1 T9SS type A sorting domain-containing protein [Crocinitomicaceae bacterium]